MQDRATLRNGESLSQGPSATTPLTEKITAFWPAASWRDVHVAVAVSGGADSVALLRGLLEMKQQAGGRGTLTVLHFDHGVRGEAAAADADWVAMLADQHQLECRRGEAVSARSDSEESLRDVRRQFYREQTAELGARYLATGHTADDQAETVLFRALRGSGLRGLSGIRPTAWLSDACTLVRPLLEVTRGEIEAYLARLEQPYREDATNGDINYTRNWLRHEVLPLIEQRFPEARNRLASLAQQAAESADCLRALADELIDQAISTDHPNRLKLEKQPLANQPRAFVVEAVRLAWRRAGWPEQAMNAAAWQRLAELASTPEALPAEMFPGGVRAESVDEKLVLSRLSARSGDGPVRVDPLSPERLP